MNDLKSLEEIYNKMVLNEGKEDVVKGKEGLTIGNVPIEKKSGAAAANKGKKVEKAPEDLQGEDEDTKAAPKKLNAKVEEDFDSVFDKILAEAEDDDDLLPEDEPTGDLDLEDEDGNEVSDEIEDEIEDEVEAEGDEVTDLVADLNALRDQINSIIERVSAVTDEDDLEDPDLEEEEEILDEIEDEIEDDLGDEDEVPYKESKNEKRTLAEAKGKKCTVGKVKPKGKRVTPKVRSSKAPWKKAPNKLGPKSKPVVSKPKFD